MPILIISDIHANLSALDSVLEEAGEVDAVWCLGDLVGYGPDPNECISRIRQLPNLKCILGNHDAAALNQIDVDTFNPEARTALHWTQRTLNEASLAFLGDLPEQLIIETGPGETVTLTHGSPRHPVWEYLLDTRTATVNFEYFGSSYCFVGHTHLPVIYLLTDSQRMAHLLVPEANTRLQLLPRAIINPGSVGQPRDRDTRSSFIIYDPEVQMLEYRRASYDITAVQARMLAAGLPDRHIQRLAAGW